MTVLTAAQASAAVISIDGSLNLVADVNDNAGGAQEEDITIVFYEGVEGVSDSVSAMLPPPPPPVSASAAATITFQQDGGGPPDAISGFTSSMTSNVDGGVFTDGNGGNAFGSADALIVLRVADTPVRFDYTFSGPSDPFESNAPYAFSNSVGEIRNATLTFSMVLSGEPSGSIELPVGTYIVDHRLGSSALYDSDSGTSTLTGTFAPLGPQFVRWIDSAGGMFSDGENWEGGGAPGVADNALFDLGGAYTVTFDANAETDSLTVRAGNVNLETDDSRYGVKRLEVGGGTGSTTLLVNSSNAITLNEHGMLAEEIVVDAGGILRNSGQLFVGDVDFPASGSGSNQAITDLQATEALRVRNGGVVLAAQTRIDGADDGSGVGVAEITGVGSTLSTTVLRLGENVAATLDDRPGRSSGFHVGLGGRRRARAWCHQCVRPRNPPYIGIPD